MIARIVTGSGRNRRSFDIPSSNDRKAILPARLAMGNTLKSKYLFRTNGAFKAAQARGAAAVSA